MITIYKNVIGIWAISFVILGPLFDWLVELRTMLGFGTIFFKLEWDKAVADISNETLVF